MFGLLSHFPKIPSAHRHLFPGKTEAARRMRSPPASQLIALFRQLKDAGIAAAQPSPNWKASTHWARSLRIRCVAGRMRRAAGSCSARREISESSTLPLPLESKSPRAPSQCDINNRPSSTQLFAALLLLPQWPRALRPRRLHNNSPFASNLRTILCNLGPARRTGIGDLRIFHISQVRVCWMLSR